MKIKSVILENFFGYRGEHEIPFDSNLTVVKGENDNGKSTILHAIRWITHNEPKGAEVIWRNDQDGEVVEQEKKASVTVIMEDDSWVKKSRTKSKTSYETSTTDGVFETSEIPQEVIDILGIKNYKLGTYEADLNFLFQHDRPMILADSPGEGAAVLGSLANTGIIDNTATRVEKASKGYKREINSAEAEINVLRDKISDYDLVLEYVDYVKELQEKDKALKEKRVELGVLNNLNAKYSEVEASLENLKKTRETLKPLPLIKEDLFLVTKKILLHNEMKVIVEKHIECKDKMYKLKKIKDELKDVEYMKSKLSPLMKKSRDHRELATLEAQYNHNETERIRLRKMASKLTRLNDITTKKLEKLIKDMSSISELYTEYENMLSKKEALISNKEKLMSLPDALEVKKLQEKLLILKDIWGLDKNYNLVVKKQDELVAKRWVMYKLPKPEEVVKLKNKVEKFHDLSKVEAEYNSIAAQRRKLLSNNGEIKKELEEKNQELKRMWEEVGGICPTCNLPIDRH